MKEDIGMANHGIESNSPRGPIGLNKELLQIGLDSRFIYTDENFLQDGTW